MFHARRPYTFPSLGLAVLLAAPAACTKSQSEATDEAGEAAPEAKAEAQAGGGDKGADDRAEAKTTAAQGLTKVVAEGLGAETSDDRMTRGQALGHFVLPHPVRFLDEIRTQAAPAKSAAFLNEAMLRSLASMQLGSRSGIAQHVALDKPMGCVLVDEATVDLPVACTVGYEGGAKGVVADLGAEGQQADAGEHIAHYRVGGEDLYIDDLGGHVVVSNHPAVFAKASSYLETNVIGRAEAIADDFELVLYPNAAMTRYSREVETLTSLMDSAPTPPSDNPLTAAFADYSRKSVDNSLDVYRNLDQVTVGVGLDAVGFVLRFVTYPTPGSSIEADTKSVTAGPIDPSVVKQLPSESWLVTASTVNWGAVWSTESAADIRDLLINAYAGAVGREPAEVTAALSSFVAENADLYGNDIALAIAHLPGTQGGLIISRKLDKPSRDSWKTWSAGFTPESVLGPEGAKQVTWSFTPAALTVEGVEVDRWTLEPGAEGKAELARDKDPTLAEIERRLGGLKLVIDRVELDDRVLFVLAPAAEERYIGAAIKAVKGGPSADADPGLTDLLTRQPKTSGMMAVSVAGALGWAREVLPPEATRKIPSGLGRDLGDVSLAITYGASGSQRGEMVLSQSMIDQLRKLAD